MMTPPNEYRPHIVLNSQGIILEIDDKISDFATLHQPIFSQITPECARLFQSSSPWSTVQTIPENIILWEFEPFQHDQWLGYFRMLPSWWDQMKELRIQIESTPMIAWEKINQWFSGLYPITWGCQKEEYWFQKPANQAHQLSKINKNPYSFSFFSDQKWVLSEDFLTFLHYFTDTISPTFQLLDQLNHVFFSVHLDSDFRIIQVSDNWFSYWGNSMVYQLFTDYIEKESQGKWANGGIFSIQVQPGYSLTFLFHPVQVVAQGHMRVVLQAYFFPFQEPKSNQFTLHLLCSSSGELIWSNKEAQNLLKHSEPKQAIWTFLPPKARQESFEALLEFSKGHPNQEVYYQWPIASDTMLTWQIKFSAVHQHWEFWGNFLPINLDFIQSWQVFNEIYQPIFLANASPMWIYEPQTWRILDVNQAACNQYGYRREEFKHLTLVDMRPPDQVSELFKNTAKLYPQGQTDFGVYVHVKKNGSKFKTRISGFPIQHNQKTYIIATGHPIMEEALEKYSLALQMSEKKLKAAAKMAKLGYWELNLINFELTWSQEMYDVYEVDPTTFFPTHTTFLDLIQPQDLDQIRQVWEGIENGQTEFELIFQTKPLQGKTRWIQDRSQYEFNPHTQEKWLRGTSQDITDQKAEALKLSLFERIVGGVKEAIIILQPDPYLGYIATYCNPSFSKLTGCSCESFLGKNPLEWYQSSWSKEQIQAIYSNLTTQNPIQITFLHTKQSGEIYWSNLSFQPVQESLSAHVFWVLTDRDVTQQKNEALQWKMGAEISRFFSQSETLHDALIDTLDYLADMGRFDIAEFWFLDPTVQKLYLKAHLGRSEIGQLFYSHSSLVLQFGLGEGLPGQVWQNGQIQFWKIGEEALNFPRRRAAQQAGLHEVWGIPVRHQQRMIGVLLVGRGIQLGFQELTHQVLMQMEWLLGAEITRKQMETQLLELFTFSPDLLGILGPNGLIRNINPAFAQTFGYSFEELVGKDLSFILENNPKTMEWVQDTSGTQPAILAKSFTKHGEQKWISWTRSFTGEPEEYRFIYGRDITPQVQAREELEKKTQQLNVLSEINSALLQESNWMDPMYRGMKWMAQVIQVDRVSFYSLQNTKAHLQLEWCNPDIPKRYKTGNWISEELSAHPKLLIKLHQGQVVTQANGPKEGPLFSSFSYLILPILVNSKAWGFWIFENLGEPHEWDIEEYTFLGTLSQNFTKAIESQHHKGELITTLREKERILQSISDGFVVIDDQFKWQYLNRTAEHLLQINATQWKGKSVVSTLPFTPDTHLVQIVMGAVKTKETASFEIFYPPTNLWFDIKIYPTGEGLTVYFQDITDRKNQQETLAKMNSSLAKTIHELQILNDELAQFAFIASHDLQEPLRMITSFLQQLERKYAEQLDDRAKQYIQFATDGAKRMRQIITDLLQYSRVGKQIENAEDLDLSELVDDFRLLRKKLIQDQNVHLTLRTSGRFRFYRSPIVQVLHCLLDNAIRYVSTDRIPTVDVWMEENTHEWIFSIQDNGIGIDSVYFDKIFSMFQRLHDRETYDGTGMGLAIVKKQVENWGGKVTVSSTLQKGSTFVFTVPKIQSYES